LLAERAHLLQALLLFNVKHSYSSKTGSNKKRKEKIKQNNPMFMVVDSMFVFLSW